MIRFNIKPEETVGFSVGPAKIVEIDGGTYDHSELINRDAADQHPMSAITGLDEALAGKQAAGSYLTHETDPTVPAWAKKEVKPSYNAEEVGADPAGTAIAEVGEHNVSLDSHNDIRLIVSSLIERLNALADSDDDTLDQMAEVVAYIKDNRELIEQVTTGKVSVSDIIDNLTTNVVDKPLSAAQGVALKSQLDKKAASGHNHSAAAITQGTLNIARFPTITVAKGGTGATDAETARVNLGVPSVEEMNAAFNALKTEEWTFTLEDGSTVTKAVYVG